MNSPATAWSPPAQNPPVMAPMAAAAMPAGEAICNCVEEILVDADDDGATQFLFGRDLFVVVVVSGNEAP